MYWLTMFILLALWACWAEKWEIRQKETEERRKEAQMEAALDRWAEKKRSEKDYEAEAFDVCFCERDASDW